MGQFDECVHSLKARYCLTDVYLSLQPGAIATPFWNRIQAQSWEVTKYHRDHLLWGVCVPNEPDISDIAAGLQQVLAPSASRLKLHVRVTVSVKDCQQETAANLDAADLAVCAVLVLIGLIVILGTLAENIQTQNTGVRFLICFSLVSNWNRLAADNPGDGIRLRCVQGMRFLTTVLIILGHRLFLLESGALENPDFLEQSFDDPVRIIVVNGHLIVATFFAMSGFLLSYGFLREVTHHDIRISVKHIGLTYLYRYFRLTPAYAVTLAITATLLDKIGDGPLWPRHVTYERENCRSLWWTNLLYVNNYLGADTPCMLHSWYLAADTQLFAVVIVLLAVARRWPKATKPLLATCLALSVWIPMLQTYWMNLDPTLLIYPETLRNITVDRTYLYSYVPSHMNAGPYLMGIILGYDFYKTWDKPASKWLVVFWWMTSLVVPLSTMWFVYWFYPPHKIEARWVSVLYAGIYKPLFALGMCCILAGCSRGYGWCANAVLSWKPLQVLGRLTYCAYLVHFSLQRVSVGLLTSPVYLNEFFLIQQCLSDVCLSYALALVLCLCVELPISALWKLLLQSPQDEHPQEKLSHAAETEDYTSHL